MTQGSIYSNQLPPHKKVGVGIYGVLHKEYNKAHTKTTRKLCEKASPYAGT